MKIDGLELNFIKQLTEIMSKSETMEEFLIKSDLYGWDEEKRKNIYKFIVKAVISYSNTMNHFVKVDFKGKTYNIKTH